MAMEAREDGELGDNDGDGGAATIKAKQAVRTETTNGEDDEREEGDDEGRTRRSWGGRGARGVDEALVGGDGVWTRGRFYVWFWFKWGPPGHSLDPTALNGQ